MVKKVKFKKTVKASINFRRTQKKLNKWKRGIPGGNKLDKKYKQPF